MSTCVWHALSKAKGVMVLLDILAILTPFAPLRAPTRRLAIPLAFLI